MMKKKINKIIFETDWLASEPVFYNLKTYKASNNINEVISLKDDLNFHSEGLNNFLDYGYSIFGQTPIRDIKFLSPASQIIREDDGKLLIKNLSDPIEKWIDFKLSENDIVELVRERIQKWEKSLQTDQ